MNFLLRAPTTFTVGYHDMHPDGSVNYLLSRFGAEFSHVDVRVTVEAMLRSFNLDQDHALSRLASLVQQLQVGGIPVAAAAGVAAIIASARALQADDDELLKSITPVLSASYATFSGPLRAD
jgi:hypothetical protein